MGSFIKDVEVDMCGSSVKETVKAIESGRLLQARKVSECSYVISTNIRLLLHGYSRR